MSLIITENDSDECFSQNIALGSVAIYSIRDPEKNSVNEDSLAIIPVSKKSCVLVVADGAGGMRAGALASAITVQNINKSVLQGIQNKLELRDSILNGIESANKEVLALGIGAYTTVAIAEIQDQQVRTYHVGDSMILVVGQRGKIKLQTISHSPVGYAIEAGVLDEQEAMLHEERHLVSNMIGDPNMHISIGPTVQLASYDSVLIASDGLFDNLSIEEIVAYCRKDPIKKSAFKLKDNACDRMEKNNIMNPGKPDDLSFIEYRCKPLIVKR
jgi:serine/threonine protein phosphatase PrpC